MKYLILLAILFCGHSFAADIAGTYTGHGFFGDIVLTPQSDESYSVETCGYYGDGHGCSKISAVILKSGENRYMSVNAKITFIYWTGSHSFHCSYPMPKFEITMIGNEMYLYYRALRYAPPAYYQNGNDICSTVRDSIYQDYAEPNPYSKAL